MHKIYLTSMAYPSIRIPAWIRDTGTVTQTHFTATFGLSATGIWGSGLPRQGQVCFIFGSCGSFVCHILLSPKAGLPREGTQNWC